MKYKYKESIKNAVTEMYSASFVDEENRKNELDEVYRKAEAFDEVIEASENIDNYIDFSEAIDEIVIRYKEASQ